MSTKKNTPEEQQKIYNDAMECLESGDLAAAIKKFRHLYEKGDVFLGAKGLCLCYDKAQRLSDEYRRENELPEEPWNYCFHFGHKALNVEKDADVLHALAKLHITSPMRNVYSAVDYSERALKIRPDDKAILKTYVEALSLAGGVLNLSHGISLLEGLDTSLINDELEEVLTDLRRKREDLLKKSKKPETQKKGDSRYTLRCSFCGKEQGSVKKLIAGPRVYICDECIDLCQEILEEGLEKPTDDNGKDDDTGKQTPDRKETSAEPKIPEDEKNGLRCSFCEKSQYEVNKLIAGPGVYICDECAYLCIEFIEEELSDK